MAKNISGEDLFGKYSEGNLNRKALQKAKKSERVDIIGSNLPFLVDFYFNMGRKKDWKWSNHVYELVGSEKYFMVPLMKIMKIGKKKKVDLTDVPNGLHVIMMDSIDRVRSAYDEKIRRYENQNRSGETNAMLEELRQAAAQQFTQLNDIITVLVSKDTKRLVKFGIAEQYATRIARCFVPPKYLTKYNVAKYFHRLNRALVDVIKMAMVPGEDPETFTNEAGINLALDTNIQAIYEYFFRKCKRDTYLAGLLSVLLERKSRIIDSYTKPQREMHNAITRVILDLLEGTAVLNTTGEKVKKKELKKMAVDKKELKKIIKQYTNRRAEDYRKGNDSPRRIIFDNLAPDVYPKLIEAFNKQNTTTAKEMLELDSASREQEQREQREKEQKEKENNNKGNKGRFEKKKS